MGLGVAIRDKAERVFPGRRSAFFYDATRFLAESEFRVIKARRSRLQSFDIIVDFCQLLLCNAKPRSAVGGWLGCAVHVRRHFVG
jgi:hypothetical protein